MRRAIALALSLTLNGCAARRAPVADGPDARHDWASVFAIPRGAAIRATLDHDIHGRLDDVTDATLTIRVPPDMHRLTVSRARVVRVSVLVPKQMRWRWLRTPLAAGIVGGLTGALVGAAMRDAEVASISLGIFAASSIGGFYHFVSHRVDHEWRVVYVRQKPIAIWHQSNYNRSHHAIEPRGRAAQGRKWHGEARVRNEPVPGWLRRPYVVCAKPHALPALHRGGAGAGGQCVRSPHVRGHALLGRRSA